MPGKDISLGEETRRNLGGALSELVQDAERDRATFIRDAEVHLDWYDARPLQQIRSEPWSGASNIVVPLIQTMADGVISRVWGQMHTENRTWTAKTANESKFAQTSAKTLDEFINLESRSTFDILRATYDWVWEMVVLGQGVLGLRWSQRLGHRWTPGAGKPQLVELSRGPDFESIPFESALWERDRTIQESSYFIRQALMSWPDMVRAAQVGGWDKDATRACERMSGIIGPSGSVLHSRREREGQNPGSGYAEPHDIREVWVEWSLASMLGKGIGGTRAPEFADIEEVQIPVVLTYHRTSRQVVRAIAHPYFFSRWPFLDVYFRKRAHRGSSRGLAKMLEHMQRAMTTMVNQGIDATTFANWLKLWTSDPALKNKKITPGEILFSDMPNGINVLNIPNSPGPNIGITQLIQVFAERLTGLSDANFGRETRLGGHPSPATNTMAQLQEGAKVLSTTLRMARQALSQGGEWAAALYQQHDLGDDGKLAARMGEADAERLRQLVISPESIRFSLHSMSDAVNMDQERQSAIMVTQMSANYYSFVLRMLSIIENPQTASLPLTRDAAMKAIESYTHSFTRFLNSAEIDEVDEFLISMKENKLGDAGEIQRFGDFARERVGTPAQGNGGPSAGGVQGPAMGAVGGELADPAFYTPELASTGFLS